MEVLVCISHRKMLFSGEEKPSDDDLLARLHKFTIVRDYRCSSCREEDRSRLVPAEVKKRLVLTKIGAYRDRKTGDFYIRTEERFVKI